MRFQEIRYAFRLMLRSPGLTAIAILSLALGIGATASVFSLADAALLRPLPVTDPGSIVTVETQAIGDQFDVGVSYPNYREIRKNAQAFQGLFAFRTMTFSFAKTSADIPNVRAGMVVSDNFFSVLDVQPAMGRGFLPDEGTVPGRDAVVVLDYGVWNDQFNHDPSIVGSKLRINGIDCTIVGVAPSSFFGVDQFLRPAFYVPSMMYQRLLGRDENPLENRESHVWLIKGRLKSDVPRQRAQAELDTIWQDIQRQFPEPNRSRVPLVQTELQARVRQRPDAKLFAMLMVLVVLVLMIACANVANLLLGRARSRAHEMALRIALGVSRTRLLRQLLTESLLLSLVSAVVGTLFAYGGTRFLQTLPPPSDLDLGIYPQLDRRALMVCLFAGLLCALFVGLAPALKSIRTNVIFNLKNTGTGMELRRRTLGRNILVITQIALSMVLLVATGMLLDAFRKTLVLNPGFHPDHLMMMEFDTSLVRYNGEQTKNFYRNLVLGSQALPGVRRVSLASSVPFAAQNVREVVPEGYVFTKRRETLAVLAAVVDERYFETMKVEIARGRAFTADDKDGSRRVVIVNEEFAKRYWPNQDAIGKRIELNDNKGPWLEVIAVAKTGKYLFIVEPPTPFIYLPFEQNQSASMILLAASYSDPTTLATPLIKVVHSLDANQPVHNIRTFDEFYTQRAIRVPLMIIEIVAFTGLLGFVLALIGIYGLVSYSVATRTREIGVRMAIGATKGIVLKMVLRQGLVLSGVGLIVGGLISLVTAPALAAGLAGLGAPSPVTFVVVPLAVLLVTTAACYVPARRASLVDPILALRYE
jgi:putative ABC transport system permease protein